MSSLDQLLRTPAPELVADLKEMRTERAVIESKEAVLEQLIEMLVQRGGKPAEEIAALGAPVAIGPLRHQILQVLESKREEDEFLLVPKDVHEELVARGNRTVTLDNVRVTMKRMAESGEIEQPQPLGFGLKGTTQALNAVQTLAENSQDDGRRG